jgi:hypothetical protein
MSRSGRVNGWGCKECGEYTYCIDIDDGVTPFYLGCRATEGCKGKATSLFYPSADLPNYVRDQVKWEWYKPEPEEYQTLNEGMKEHVDKGGLMIRELTDRGRKVLEEA